MNMIAPPSAFFLPEPTGQNNGVDFLGVRQANLDMMADIIPGINNVTAYVRPFSLLSWIFWKFHALCVGGGIDEPTSESVRLFRERIEILFTWGARLEDYPNIPGKQAEPPAGKDGYVSLNFKSWNRIQTSTSLIAALWYGPASKVVTGLGLLMPVPGRSGFFRTAGAGIRLAEALDAHLRATAAFWWKAFNFFIEEEDYIAAEVKYIFREIYGWFLARSLTKGNNPKFHRFNGKMQILNAANAFFEIPKTICGWGNAITSEMHSKKRIVAKSLTSGLTVTNKALFTTEVDVAKLDPRYPWYLQMKIDAKSDVTIFVSIGVIKKTCSV